MLTETASHSQTDNRWFFKRNPIRGYIFNPQHDIICFIGGHVIRRHIIIPQKLFRLLQLHYDNIRIRSRPQEIQASVQGAPRRSRSHCRPMTYLINRRHQFQRLLRLKSLVYLLSRIFASIKIAIRGRARLHTLIPDGQNPGTSIRSPENRIPIVDTRIHKSQHHISAGQRQRFSLNQCYSAFYKGLDVKITIQGLRGKGLHQTIQPGYIPVIITGYLQGWKNSPAVVNRQKSFIHGNITENIVISLDAPLREDKIIYQINIIL